MEPVEVEVVKLPMRCACGEARRAELDAKIAAGEWTVDRLLYTLQWVTGPKPGHAYSTEITVVSDMWMRVTIILSAYNDDEDDETEWYVAKRVSAECDRMIDGLLALYEYLEQPAGEPDAPPAA